MAGDEHQAANRRGVLDDRIHLQRPQDLDDLLDVFLALEGEIM